MSNKVHKANRIPTATRVAVRLQPLVRRSKPLSRKVFPPTQNSQPPRHSVGGASSDGIGAVGERGLVHKPDFLWAVFRQSAGLLRLQIMTDGPLNHGKGDMVSYLSAMVESLQLEPWLNSRVDPNRENHSSRQFWEI